MSKKELNDKTSDAENSEETIKSETPAKKPRKRKAKPTEKEVVVINDDVKAIAEEVVSDNLEKAPAIKVVLESPNKSISIDSEFDWDKIANNDAYNESERQDLEKTYSATLPEVEDKQVIDGKVVTISEREVIVDINFKSDGVISSSEFKYNEELKIGDLVEVLVEKQEDKKGQLVLSHRRARVLRAWEKVNVALGTGEVVNGQIKSRTKGGMIVDVFGIECFLPGSQIDVKPIRDYDEYVGKHMEFKVVKVNESFRNVVVSHKALIEADLAVQTKEIMSKLEKGQVIEGTVKNITSYGVFVDLGV
jgi:small subunit ribosomal protein S1